MFRKMRLAISLLMVICVSICTSNYKLIEAKTASPYDRSDFVVVADVIPDVLQEIRYYSAYNFVGSRIDGYEEPVALLTREAVVALKEAAVDFRKAGYVIKIYDAYRPQRAVDHFMRWAANPSDVKMKDFFYPRLEKKRIIPEGYVATRSNHSRGSTVDMTIVNMKTGQELDVGEHFDYFGERSHPDFKGVTPQQQANRNFIREIMVKHGFDSLDTEWWHYTLKNQPYPTTRFDFPVRRAS